MISTLRSSPAFFAPASTDFQNSCVVPLGMTAMRILELLWPPPPSRLQPPMNNATAPMHSIAALIMKPPESLGLFRFPLTRRLRGRLILENEGIIRILAENRFSPDRPPVFERNRDYVFAGRKRDAHFFATFKRRHN